MPIWDNFMMGKACATTALSSGMAIVVEDCDEVDDECLVVSLLPFAMSCL